jgi:hypothetical protein
MAAIRILPDPLRRSPHLYSGQVRRLHWKRWPFHRGYRKRPRRLLNWRRPLGFLSYRRIACRLRLSGLTSHCSTPCIVQMRPSMRKTPLTTGDRPGCKASSYEATLRARNYLPCKILDYMLSCQCQGVGNSQFVGGVMLSTILLLG